MNEMRTLFPSDEAISQWLQKQMTSQVKRFLATKERIKAQDLQNSFPCIFTDEEWQEELNMSLSEGEASDSEISEFYRKWNVAI